MKKALVAALICLAAHTVSAQTSFGIKAGPNMSFLRYKVEAGDEKETWDGSRVGFQVGGVAQIGIAENFALQPELLFVMKGANKVRPSSLGNEIDFSLMTIDMPINFIYRTNGFFGGFGPNLQFGVSSKAKSGGEEYDMYDKDESSFFYQKRFEVGVNVLAGYKLTSGLAFSLNFAKGLTNSSGYNDDLDDATIKQNSSYLGLSIGYFFGK
ncbi:PorT family protein [Nostoc ellipsosporum NOK]|nr:PorT family protein [Nostoc ellipsosporum NOK]